MAQKIVGVDLGTHHIKVVVVSSGLRGVSVVDAFEEPVGAPVVGGSDDEADPLGAVLGVTLGVLRRKRLLGNPIAIALPAGMLSYRVLSFPFSDVRRIAQTVAFEAEGQFPVSLDQLAHGHVIVPTPGGGGRALVVAAKSERVSQIAAAFRHAGADVKLVTSGAVAAAQVAMPSLPKLSPEGVERGLQPASLVVDFGHSSTQMTALSAKGPVAVRAHRRGGRHITAAMARSYSLEVAEAETAKHSDGFVPHRGFDDLTNDQLESGRVIAQALEPIVRELEHTRLWLRSTYNLEVGKILIAGGGADLKGIDEYLAEHIELPVERLAPKVSLLKGTEGRDWTSMCGALGAAYGAARRPLVQLHEGPAADGDSSWLQERMTSLIAIGVAVMAFGALDTIAQVKALEAEHDAYAEELEAATLETFGEVLMSSAKISAKLASVQGADMTSLVPERGALEILAMVVEAITPSDLAEAPPPGETGEPLPGVSPELGAGPAALLDPTGFGPGPEGPVDPLAEPVEPAPVSADAGIVMSDEFIVQTLDIRPQMNAGVPGAIDLRASARVSSAQDRLERELHKRIGCFESITKGKVKSTSDKKQFDMEIVHNCNYAQPETPEVSEEDTEAEE